jgi:hypothetical protein
VAERGGSGTRDGTKLSVSSFSVLGQHPILEEFRDSVYRAIDVLLIAVKQVPEFVGVDVFVDLGQIALGAG